MNSILIFLAVLHLANFTFVAYILSKTEDMSPWFPLSSFHQIFTLLEIVFLSLVFKPFMSDGILFYTYWFSLACYLNRLFNLRYFIFGSKFIVSLPTNVIWELRNLSRQEHVYDFKSYADLKDAIAYNQDRMAVDITLFCLITALIII